MRAGSLRLRDIVGVQSTHGLLSWNFFGGFQFVAFFIYLMAAYAETNRSPFDLPEAESELTAGYHTEYSSMKFAMFFMAEYANMITVGCVATLLFFGGWTSPFGSFLSGSGPVSAALFPIFWFVLKVFFFLFLYIWVRGTLPRFRYDQLMGFGWKFLVPVAIANIVVTACGWGFGCLRTKLEFSVRCLVFSCRPAVPRVIQNPCTWLSSSSSAGCVWRER